jgi:hypothetical protein
VVVAAVFGLARTAADRRELGYFLLLVRGFSG